MAVLIFSSKLFILRPHLLPSCVQLNVLPPLTDSVAVKKTSSTERCLLYVTVLAAVMR